MQEQQWRCKTLWAHTCNGMVQMSLHTKGGREIVLPMNGYGGFRSWIQHNQSVQVSAQQPAEWLAKDQCTAREWVLFKGARDRFHYAQQRVRAIQVLVRPVAPPNTSPDHPPPQSGQATMHGFGSTEWVQPPEPDQERHIAQHQQSMEAWHQWQRSAQAAVTFDITSMLPTAPCLRQGSWDATSLHGQSVIRQYPRPFQSRMERLTPDDDDLVLDTAQLKAIMAQCSSLLQVAAGVARQPAADEREQGWAKLFTSRVGQVNDLKNLWGCTALTADQHYQNFVSPDAEDEHLGSLPFEQ